MLTPKEETKKRFVQTIAITSGKGGVGKTNVAANLAIALRNRGKKVMILDADLGLSNIDVLLHLAPHYNIKHVLSGERSLRDVIVEGPHGIKILAASSGEQDLTALNEFQRLKLLEAFDSYDEDMDVLLIDTGAGISENVAFFCVAAQQIVIVTSPEPTAITDAYALVKVLCTRYQEKEFHVLVNSAKSPEEGEEVFRRLSLATERFLSISLNYLGHLPLDEAVAASVREQRPFIDAYPYNPVSGGIRQIAARLSETNAKVKGTLQFFIGNLLSASTHS